MGNKSSNLPEYIKQMAMCSGKGLGDGNLLGGIVKNADFNNENTALYCYLHQIKKEHLKKTTTMIFPFGCNNSQYQAVLNAMNNQISIIQGPPGTGKTQTILNIIANLLVHNKTILVVSFTNSATTNVFDKLKQYDLSFVAAKLGSKENKELFISEQEDYPDFSSWHYKGDYPALTKEIIEKCPQLKTVFDMQEKLAHLNQELSKLILEEKHFQNYIKEQNINLTDYKYPNKNPNKWFAMWQKVQKYQEKNIKNDFLFKILMLFRYGFQYYKIYKNDLSHIVSILQHLYYRDKKNEIKSNINDTDTKLKGINYNLYEKFVDMSMQCLKNELAKKYSKKDKRIKFEDIKQLSKSPSSMLKEYPVILSSTFSSSITLNSSTKYDYVIIDEASQVDIVTGTLALSVAKNAVIVGDLKQLPTPSSEKKEIKNESNKLLNKYKIDEKYSFSKSFLESIQNVLITAPFVLLKEHYRCHPKIIEFCNQKFYNGQLIIMTEDKQEKDVLSVYKTVRGNHARDHFNQRQIDVLKKEVLPKLKSEDIGVIAPYNNQVDAIKKQLNNLEVSTVHKYQGREKNDIVISTVDDMISVFSDDPKLLNVAVSRAKKRLVLIVNGNENGQGKNIKDLIDYIEYNNFDIVESKVYSIFDFLYKQNSENKIKYLKKYKNVSQYESENLMYSLIKKILEDEKFSHLDVIFEYPLNRIVKDISLLNNEELRYISSLLAHIDFLIYNKITHKAVLAIEVDGYVYHKDGTRQHERDVMKDHILSLYKIDELRFSTIGSGEEEKIREKLKDM